MWCKKVLAIYLCAYNIQLFLSSINQFENDINKLGLSTTERSKLNKTILDSAADKAREIGYQTGDSDIALKIFDSIKLYIEPP